MPADLQCREEAWRQLEESQDSDEANGFTVGWPQQPWLAAYRDLDFRGAQFDIIRGALPAFGYESRVVARLVAGLLLLRVAMQFAWMSHNFLVIRGLRQI